MYDQGTAPIIMFVDDEPENLNLLQEFFAKSDYALRFFTSGAHALKAAQEDMPDLVLLDIRLPGMDGYDVCRQFKADERLRAIPILFLSALTSTEEIAKGFSMGAVDYITKPFREAEVLARVRNHLALSRAYRQLAQQHVYLQELERQRDTYVHMLVHDMRSSLMAMSCHLRAIEVCGAKHLSEDDRASFYAVMQSTRTLSHMVSNVVDLSRMEHAQLALDPKCVTVETLFQRAREQVLDPGASSRVLEQISEGCPAVLCDCGLSVRIVGNFLANAVKYTPEATNIILGAEAISSGAVRIWVRDYGAGIRPEDQARIFEKFVSAKHLQQGNVPSTGLGLAFCKLAVEAQGGTIGVDSDFGAGSFFWFTLPRADQTLP